jgi:hypothetical protein
MSITKIREKVHKYIDEADVQVLEAIAQLLEIYRQSNASVLTEAQQKEVLKRTARYKAGKAKGYTVAEARKIIKQKTSRKEGAHIPPV